MHFNHHTFNVAVSFPFNKFTMFYSANSVPVIKEEKKARKSFLLNKKIG